VAALAGVATTIAYGVLFGVLQESSRPPSPASNLRGDRAAAALTIGIFVLVGSLGGLLMGLLRTPLLLGTTVTFGLGTGLVVGIVAAARHRWSRYQVARIGLAIIGRLPWRLLEFMEEAHDLGILRQVGAVYQFRHARLQDRLARDGAKRDE